MSYERTAAVSFLELLLQNAGSIKTGQIGNPEEEPSARGYNWATLFLGDINTGTWPSRLGESQMRQ
jgi:hypothetical protein